MLRGSRAPIVGLAGLAAIVVAAFVFDDATVFPGVAAALPVVGTAVLLAAIAARRSDRVFAPLRHRLMQWLGRHSYGWYLWHWPLVAVTLFLWPDTSAAWLVLVSLVGLACAALMLKAVERPARTSAWLIARPALSVALGGVLVAASLGAAMTAKTYAAAAARRPDQRAIAAVRERPLSRNCMLTPLEVAARPDCAFGVVTSTQTVVLFGDSHAAQWVEAADAFADARGWRLVVATKAECPSAEVPRQMSSLLHRHYRECDEWRARTLREIVAMRPVVTLLGSSEFYGQAPRVWTAAVRSTSLQLEAAGLDNVVLLDTPNPARDIPLCLSRAAFTLFARKDCDFPRSDALVPTIRDTTVAAIAGLSHARAVDMNDLICPRLSCSARRGKLIVYRDDGHLSDEFVLSLAPAFGDRISRAFPQA